MSAWRATILRRSTAFRLAASMAGLFAVSTILAFIAASLLISRDLEQRTRMLIEDDARSFEAIYQSEGLSALIRQVRTHALTQREDVLYYYHSDTAGRARAGNVVVEAPFTGWRLLEERAVHRPDGDVIATAYLALGVRVGDGILIVGRSRDSIEEVEEDFARATLGGLGLALVLAIGGTFLVARRTEARIAAIAAALDAVAAGDLDRRAPEGSSAADDLSRVTVSINSMLGRLADTVTSLKQVSADIAHDLKTPIQGLRSTLEGARNRVSMTPETAAAIEDAVEQTDHIVQTFQALLRITQIEGGSPRSRFRPTDMVELVQAVADAFQPVAEETGHRFLAEVPEGEPLQVMGDRDLMAQMLANLLTNAIRHAPPPADISLSLRATGDSVILAVSDTGPGIPPAERERVFRRLYRLERSRTTEGSGLGLSLVAAIVALHDGSIRLENNEPGLRAVVCLPRLDRRATG